MFEPKTCFQRLHSLGQLRPRLVIHSVFTDTCFWTGPVPGFGAIDMMNKRLSLLLGNCVLDWPAKARDMGC